MKSPWSIGSLETKCPVNLRRENTYSLKRPLQAWRIVLSAALLFIGFICHADLALASADTRQDSNDERRKYTVGALAFADPDTVYRRWAPSLARVSAQTGIELVLVPLRPDELVERVSKDALDFIIGNALITVALKKDYGVSHLLTLVPTIHANPEQAVGTAIIAKNTIEINNLEDLKQLELISSDPNAFGGFQIFAGELINQGISPFKDLEHLDFVGFPQDKLLDHILRDSADVAILPSCVLESAIASGRLEEGQLHVLLSQVHPGFNCQTSGSLYPGYAFSKLGNTEHQIARQIVRALLDITEQDPEAKLGRYRYWSVPVEDSQVFNLLMRLERWPFVTNWQRLVEKAIPWALVITIILLLGYFHHLRVKRLVIKRTQALSDEMTQHENTQKALFEQQKQFYRAQRILLTGEMASGIAHEVNQPLAGIRYLAQGSIYRLGDSQSELKQALTKMLQQVDRAQNTVKRFRQFCQQPSVYQACDLKELIEDTLNLMQPDFNRINLKPRLFLWPLTVNVDASLMQQVFVNLLRNALDAMETSPVPQLAIGVSNDSTNAIITFSDAGTGLSEAALKRLFFPFETSKANGLGLGMVVCKRIVEEHGGKIQAFNNQAFPETEIIMRDLGEHFPRFNTGLTIILTLPLKETR
ncbi:sensor histidine kinase [Shewanella halotolerans]|uniref:sensor histidine kinase n=1 Tax=Shewanella halotolerans TaxID=2864204 RepID=UPI001C6609F4|nr:PhnD/SsuA/transferrin family substrate-binding protein [Shewanella halotolerans]QYJ91840.1 PhnD/SsuA/transferrin family substrate-binding protein [Shewanella halotolerans]